MENSTNIVQNNTTATLESRIENIENNVSAISDASLFLVAFLVVCVVCFILYKAIDNFISF